MTSTFPPAADATPRLTADLLFPLPQSTSYLPPPVSATSVSMHVGQLAIHQGAAYDYASEADSEAGSVAGSEGIQPYRPSGSTSASAARPHDPYARSPATFRGALAALGSHTSASTTPFGRPLSLSAQVPPVASSNPSASFGSSEFANLDPFTRHRRLVEEYRRSYSGQGARWSQSHLPPPPPKPVLPSTKTTDAEILQASYKFIRSPEDNDPTSYEARLAKKYYDRLFKEYCLADMTGYKTGRIGLRWRTADEVLIGRGQFTCGNKKCPNSTSSTPVLGLKSFELNFGYEEDGKFKQALVKLRLCPDCALKLHYQKIKEVEAAEKLAKQEKKRLKREKRKSSSSSKSKRKSKKKSSKRKRKESDESSTSSSDSDSMSDTTSSSDEDESKTPSHKKRRYESSSQAASSSTTSKITSATTSPPPTTVMTADGFAVPQARPPRSSTTRTSTSTSTSTNPTTRESTIPAPVTTSATSTSRPAHSNVSSADSSTTNASVASPDPDDFFQRYFPHMFP